MQDMTWTMTLRLTQRGLELHAPSVGLTVLIGPPRKCGPSLPPPAVHAIDTEGFGVSEEPSVQPNVLPFPARRSA